MKAKWLALLYPWIPFTFAAAREAHNGFTTELPIRVMVVVGTLTVSAVYAMIAQPWRPDPPTTR